AREFERAGLGLDAGLSDLSARVIEGQGADRNAGWVFAIFVEGGRQNQVLAGRQILGRRYFLLGDSDEAVDVVQSVVLHVEGMPAEARAMREQDALGTGRGNVDLGADGEGAVADIDRLSLRDVGDVGVVDVAVARAGQLRTRGGQDLDRGPVV